MIPTRPVGSVKSFGQRLHQPLPLTTREAEKLLNVLKTAFRKQLDAEHPVHEDHAPPYRRFPVKAITRDAASALSQNLPSSPNTLNAPKSPIERRTRHTDSHVRAILQNPLFSYDRNVETAKLPTAKRNPMDVFDQAVAKGMMTPRRAAGCLNAVWRDIVQSNCFSIRQAMADSGAGLRVIQWMRSSGLEHDLTFMAAPGFTRLLLKFMAAERLNDVTWSWLERLARGDGPAKIGEYPAVSFVLHCMVRGQQFEASSLDAAYETMLRAEKMLQDVGADMEENLLSSWKMLSRDSTIHASPLMTRPAPTLYERFMALGDLFCAPGLSVERAHLELHHPTKPSSESAESLLHQPVEEIDAPYQAQLRTLGLDAARFLQDAGRSADAVNLLKMLQDKLGELARPREKAAWAGI